MTMIATMLPLTLLMTVAMVPRIYWSVVRPGEVCLERERMQRLLMQRDWVLRHQRCGLVALFLVWISKACPGSELPAPLVAVSASYAASALLLVILEGLLSQKRDGILASVQVRVGDRR